MIDKNILTWGCEQEKTKKQTLKIAASASTTPSNWKWWSKSSVTEDMTVCVHSTKLKQLEKSVYTDD